MTRSATVALGVGQCVNWGILYYAFAVLLLPLERELGGSRSAVTGAFSVALLISALFAPAVGRWSDRGHGPLLLRAGGLIAAAALALWTVGGSLVWLYAVWAILGVCMAATLYEPAFTIVGRAFDTPAARLRALSTVTVIGGLASPIFMPVTSALVAAHGWRGAVGVLALLLALAALLTGRLVVVSSRAQNRAATTAPVDTPLPGFWLVLLFFSTASLASTAFVTNLVPALGERGVPPAIAASLGGLLGVMQLPGRVFLMKVRRARSPAGLLAVSFGLQAAGFAATAAGSSVPAIAAGVAGVGLGAGLVTVARPHLVQSMYGVDTAGYSNGRLARWQQFAKALGPVTMAAGAAVVGYRVLLALFGAAFAALAFWSYRHSRVMTVTHATDTLWPRPGHQEQI